MANSFNDWMDKWKLRKRLLRTSVGMLLRSGSQGRSWRKRTDISLVANVMPVVILILEASVQRSRGTSSRASIISGRGSIAAVLLREFLRSDQHRWLSHVNFALGRFFFLCDHNHWFLDAVLPDIGRLDRRAGFRDECVLDGLVEKADDELNELIWVI